MAVGACISEQPQLPRLVVVEHTGAGQKSFARRPFQREGAARAFNHVDDELGVFPVLKLVGTNVERHTTNVAQVHVPCTNRQLARQVGVGGAVVTATAGLVEEKLAVLALSSSISASAASVAITRSTMWLSLPSQGAVHPGMNLAVDQKKPSLFSL